MQMLIGLSNTDGLILLGLFLFFIIVVIAVILEGLMILALPFVLVKSLFSKDKKRRQVQNWRTLCQKLRIIPLILNSRNC